MSYSIIGLRQDRPMLLAKAFARNGIEVSIATTRDPESFASAAAAIGPTIIPKTLAEAVKADIVFSGCPFRVAPGCREGAAELEGKDHHRCDQCLRCAPLEKLGGQPSSKVVAQAFTGARLVKSFNHLVAAVLDQDPAVHGGRRGRVPGERR